MYLQPGHIFEGRYQIKGELGRGGFGTVYLAWQVNMDRHVAIKTLNLEESGQSLASARERFMREVRIISKLRHPNTVTIHDFGESSMGMVYMVLEYIEGDTLKEVLNKDGSLDQQRAISITTQIAKSLSEAHRHSIVHRDLKPANIMLTTMGNDADFVKVLDFGVAHLKDNSPDLTNAGINNEEERELIGTPRYMSPEQVRGLQLTGASDVYSLGLMLYEMLAGEPAVRGESTIALITQQVSPEPLQLPFLTRLNPSLQRIIRKATQKHLQERYHTVDVLTQELEQALIDVRQAQTNPFLQFNSAAMAPISPYHDVMSSGAIDYIQSGPSLFGAHAKGLSEETEPFELNRNGYTPSPSPVQATAHASPFSGQPDMRGMYAGAPSGRAAFDASLAMEATPPPQRYGSDWSSGAPVASSASWSSPNPPLSAMNSNSSPPPPSSWTKIINANELDDSPGLDQGYNRVDPMLASSLGADLPPPPDAMNNPFAVEPKLELEPEPRHTRRTSAIPLAAGGAVAKGSAGGLVFQLVLTLITIGALLAGYYLIFVVIGAALEKVVDGPIRLFAALIAGIMVPLVPLVAEGGKRERKDVPYRGMMRFRRALVVGIAGSFASFIIVCGIFPKQVVGQLRSNPNWFMGGHTTPGQETPMQAKNREASLKIASMVESTTVKAGLMNPQEVPRPVPAAQPNRSAVPAEETAKQDDAAAPTTKAEEVKVAEETKPTPPAAKLTTPPPTRPAVNPALSRRPPAATRPSNPLLNKRNKKDAVAPTKSADDADDGAETKKSSKKRETTPASKVQDKDYVKW